MPIRFRCKCGKIVKIEEKYAGRRATCPSCGAPLLVPNASTLPEAAAPIAEPPPSAQPPQAPSPELQLESDGLPPAGKPPEASQNALELESDIPVSAGEPAGAPESAMELESESPPAGAQPSDTVEEVMDVEEVAPESEIADVVPLPDDSVPKAAPSAPASEKACPNCGVPVPAGATACAECGASLMPEKAPAKKKLPLPKALKPLQPVWEKLQEFWQKLPEAWQKLREHKAFPLIAAVGAVVFILIVTVIVLEVRKSKKPAPVAVAELRPRPQPAQPAKSAESPKPPPEVQFHWPGFSDPAAVARDRILKIGQELAAYLDKNHQPPAALADAGVAEADSADYTYVGAEIAALPRFHVNAYETKPSASYAPYVLFSDASARPVPAAQIPSVLLSKAGSAWLTAADAALLAKTAPVIRVTNRRFASLEVALDDKPAGVAPRRGECVVTTAAGAHQITFTAGEKKEAIQTDLKPGIVYTFVHPQQADLPWIPMKQIRAGITGQSAPTENAPMPAGRAGMPPGRAATPAPEQSLTFTVDRKEGFVIKSVKSSTQTVDFLEGDGRTALTLDLRSIAAKITRENENVMIEGPAPGQPILVNEIGRLEAGIVKFKGDITVTFRKTALGALRCEELPNTDPAAVSLPEAQQAEPGKPAASNPATTPAPRPAFPAVTYTPLPDCEAIAGDARFLGAGRYRVAPAARTVGAERRRGRARPRNPAGHWRALTECAAAGPPRRHAARRNDARTTRVAPVGGPARARQAAGRARRRADPCTRHRRSRRRSFTPTSQSTAIPRPSTRSRRSTRRCRPNRSSRRRPTRRSCWRWRGPAESRPCPICAPLPPMRPPPPSSPSP